MSTERRDGLTPAGGEYAIVTYINFETGDEVDEAVASGMVIAEYDGLDVLVMETVATYTPAPPGG